MTVTIVATSADLNAALTTAQAGDTIRLAPGVYSGVVATNLTFADAVTITSQNTLTPAVITDLTVQGSTGLTFYSLEMNALPALGLNPFKVTASQNIRFDRLNVHGTLDGNPQNDVSGFLIRTSSNVTVTNSEFQQLTHAIAQLDNNGLTISNNRIHDIQIDGVRGGGSSNVTVSGNTFWNFYAKDGDHSDAIQFWTTNTTVSAHDLVITDNLYYRGEGTAAQGVFMRDEVGGLPFQRVTITGNTIIGGMFNGIYIWGGADVTVKDNVIAGYTDMRSKLWLQDVTGGTITGNKGTAFALDNNTSGLTTANNITIAQTNDPAAGLAMFNAAHPAAAQLTGDAADNVLVGGFGISVIRGGDGADSITGGAAFDDINGNQGDDTAHGGAGDDWVVGGKGNDVLFGDAGDDLVLGNLGDDTLSGGDGKDILRGGQGADVLQGGAGDDWLSGDRGDDTITGGAGADTFHSFSGAGIDRITDFRLSEGDRVLLDAGTAYTLRQSGADTIVDMGNGDQVVLVGVSLSSLTGAWITVG